MEVFYVSDFVEKLEPTCVVIYLTLKSRPGVEVDFLKNKDI